MRIQLESMNCWSLTQDHALVERIRHLSRKVDRTKNNRNSFYLNSSGELADGWMKGKRVTNEVSSLLDLYRRNWMVIKLFCAVEEIYLRVSAVVVVDDVQAASIHRETFSHRRRVVHCRYRSVLRNEEKYPPMNNTWIRKKLIGLPSTIEWFWAGVSLTWACSTCLFWLLKMSSSLISSSSLWSSSSS